VARKLFPAQLCWCGYRLPVAIRPRAPAVVVDHIGLLTQPRSKSIKSVGRDGEKKSRAIGMIERGTGLVRQPRHGPHKSRKCRPEDRKVGQDQEKVRHV